MGFNLGGMLENTMAPASMLVEKSKKTPVQVRATALLISGGGRENEEMTRQAVIDATRRWISSIVIELNLCPFARRVFVAEKIRYVVSDAANEEQLLNDLADEIMRLAGSRNSEIETTLLIHPQALSDFLDYNDFLSAADDLIKSLGQRGVIQLASFHPHYRFAGTEADDVENYTNRSPFPMLHLLREESITAVNEAPDELLEIPRRNIETLRKLGLEAMRQKLKAIEDDGNPTQGP